MILTAQLARQLTEHNSFALYEIINAIKMRRYQCQAEISKQEADELTKAGFKVERVNSWEHEKFETYKISW